MSTTSLKKFLIFILLLMLSGLPLAHVLGQAQDVARVGFFEDVSIQPGGRVEIPVEVRNVDALYGIDITIQFDPTILEIDDADPITPGVQPALGTFLDAGLTLFNEVDNEQGSVRFVMTQVNPSEPKSGDGFILVLYFIGLQEGETDLTVSFVELAQRTGEGIDVEGVDSKVIVSTEAEEQDSTSIPVQDPTQIILIPTVEPTDAPTITPTVEPTIEPNDDPTATAISIDEQAQEENEIEENDVAQDEQNGLSDADQEDEDRGFSLMQYWWIVLIVLALAVGMGIYLIKTKEI